MCFAAIPAAVVAGVSIASAAASTGLGVASAVMSANAQSAAGAASEAQAKRNSLLANISAGEALARGGAAAGRARMAGSQVVGEQRLAYSRSGVDVNSGSAGAMQTQARMFSEMDAQTARLNAAREAWGFKTQSAEFLTQGQMAREQAASGVTGTLLAGGGQLLGKAADLLGKFAKG